MTGYCDLNFLKFLNLTSEKSFQVENAFSITYSGVGKRQYALADRYLKQKQLYALWCMLERMYIEDRKIEF